MEIDRSRYSRDDALGAAAMHLLEVIKHYRHAAAIVKQHELDVKLPAEQPLMDSFCECHLQKAPRAGASR